MMKMDGGGGGQEAKKLNPSLKWSQSNVPSCTHPPLALPVGLPLICMRCSNPASSKPCHITITDNGSCCQKCQVAALRWEQLPPAGATSAVAGLLRQGIVKVELSLLEKGDV